MSRSSSVRRSGDELHHIATGNDVIKLNGRSEDWIIKVTVYIDCDWRRQSRDTFHQVSEFVQEQLISRR